MKAGNATAPVALAYAARAGSSANVAGSVSTSGSPVFDDATALNRQAASSDTPGQSTVDPGDGDPGTAIPVGNGYMILGLFLVVYTVVKALILRMTAN